MEHKRFENPIRYYQQHLIPVLSESTTLWAKPIHWKTSCRDPLLFYSTLSRYTIFFKISLWSSDIWTDCTVSFWKHSNTCILVLAKETWKKNNGFVSSCSASKAVTFYLERLGEDYCITDTNRSTNRGIASRCSTLTWPHSSAYYPVNTSIEN